MSNDSKELRERRERVILQILDELSLDLNKTIDDLKSNHTPNEVYDKFNVEAKSKIYYWLSNLYDEIEAREKNLETALDTSRQIIKKLKEKQSSDLPEQDSKKINVKEIVLKKR